MVKRKGTTGVSKIKNCKQMTALLHDYLHDNLSRKLKREFERHLRLCPDCASFLNTYKKTVAATRSLDPETIPAKVRNNVLAFLRKQIRRIGAFLLCTTIQLLA
jgi:anti-sigma factor RsiW